MIDLSPLPLRKMKAVGYAALPFGVLVVVAASACLLGYWVWLGVDQAWPLEKVISKTGKLLLVLSIFPLMKRLGLKAGDLGFAPWPLMWQQFVRGLGLGLMTLLPVMVVLYLLGVHVVDASRVWSWDWLLTKLIGGFLLALLISLAEEPIFRGILFASLQSRVSVAAAVLVSAFYYGLLHFLDSHSVLSGGDLNAFSGFILMQEAFANLINPEITSAFIALSCVGLFLGVIRATVPNSLALCIGCHTGWVWLIKFSKSLFDVDLQSPYYYLVSRYDGIVGPLVSVWMLLAVAVYSVYWYWMRAERQ